MARSGQSSELWPLTFWRFAKYYISDFDYFCSQPICPFVCVITSWFAWETNLESGSSLHRSLSHVLEPGSTFASRPKLFFPLCKSPSRVYRFCWTTLFYLADWEKKQLKEAAGLEGRRKWKNRITKFCSTMVLIWMSGDMDFPRTWFVRASSGNP